MKIRYNQLLNFFTASLILLSISGCDTGVETSKDPGIIRISLQSESGDTSIVIANNSFTVQENDQFNLKIFQAKAYSDSIYYIIYPDLDAYTQEDQSVNVLARDENQYIKYTIFESYLPVGSYDRIQFGVNADELKLGNFTVPVFIGLDEKLLMDFNFNFDIKEHEITEINFLIWPFQSIKRFQDSFQFVRKMEIVGGAQQ